MAIARRFALSELKFVKTDSAGGLLAALRYDGKLGTFYNIKTNAVYCRRSLRKLDYIRGMRV